MASETKTMGPLGRLRLRLGSLLGDETAKQSREVLARLDDHQRWYAFSFRPGATHQDELAALQQYGGSERRASGERIASALNANEQEARDRLARGHAAVEAGQPAAAALEAGALDRTRASTGEAFQELRTLADRHQAAQRTAWNALATSAAAARAGRLAQEFATLPDIPQLPKPDVTAFTGPYHRAIGLVPAGFQTGETDDVCFDPSEVEQLATAAASAAPEAEAAMTRYLYEAARGYEAAIGRERAAQLLQTLRDPTAVRDLRAQRPELFESRPALAGSRFFGGDLFTLLLVTSLLSHYAPGWQPYPGMAGAGSTSTGPGGPDAWGGELGNWLEQYDVPTGEDFEAVLAEAETFDAGMNEAADFDLDAGDVDGGGFDSE